MDKKQVSPEEAGYRQVEGTCATCGHLRWRPYHDGEWWVECDIVKRIRCDITDFENMKMVMASRIRLRIYTCDLYEEKES